MNRKGFYISKLYVTGNNVKTAKVEFKPGFNVVSGLSNTGKSYIFSCIDYLLGSGVPPKTSIPESKGYDNAYLEIKTYDDRVFTIKRNIFNGSISVKEVEVDYFQTKGELQTLLSRHSPINDKNISTFLLEICGFERPILRKNKQNITRQLSYRDLAKLSLIDEKRIITEDSPIYNGQYFDRTLEQAVFKLLLTGKDDSGLDEIEEEKVYKSRIKGKLELIERYIENTLIKLEAYGGSDNNTSQQAIKSKLEELNLLLTDSSKEIELLSKQKAKLFNKITELESNLILKSELLTRFVLLKQHYDSDIRRLEFITQGEDFFSQLSSTDCPICGGVLDKEHYDCIDQNSDQASSIILSIGVELVKIQKKRAELVSTISQESELTLSQQASLSLLKEELSKVKTKIQEKLEPVQQSSSSKIDSLMAKLSNIHEVKTLDSQLTTYFSERTKLIDLQEKKPNVADYSGKVTYSTLKSFCDSIKNILEVWEFDKISAINFDASYDIYDIIIDGKNRNAHGKGYRAIIYSAFVIALLEFTIERGLPTTGHLILDSPLTTYQGKDSNVVIEISKEDKVPNDVEKSFFHNLADLSNEIQVIILDNKDPDDEVRGKINYIHFTKSKLEGRYGFFPS